MSENISNKKNKIFKNVVLILMVFCFLFIAFSGIIKNRDIWQTIGLGYDKLPMKEISLAHDWVGVALLVLIIIHLILQRKWFVYIYEKMVEAKKVLIIITISILIIIAAYFIYTNSGDFFVNLQKSRVTELEKVEVKEYEGKDLSSLSDFHENSIKGPQYIDINNYKLEISGLVNKVSKLTYDQVLEHDAYSKIVTLNCVEGWSATVLWEGVLLKDLFEATGIQDSANTVIFYAEDGYSSSLTLDYILDNDIMLAYKINDTTLPAANGFPFQVVAEDKWGYKWVRWVTKIELSDDPDFKGYWEKAGYNQKGDLDGPKFEPY